MSRNSEEPESTALSIGRVLGVLADPSGDVLARRRCLMRSLAKEVNAIGWAWRRLETPRPGESSDHGGDAGEGATDSQIALLRWRAHASLREGPTPTEPFTKVYREAEASDPEGGRLWLAWLDPGVGQRPSRVVAVLFDPRNKFSLLPAADTLGIVLGACLWLHRAEDVPDFPAEGLTPAQVLVCGRLLAGQRRLQIATELEISPGTARDHIRAVLRRFGARDQLDLVCRHRAGKLE